ncbi:polysaccharide pyruvyl transferase family protein [Rheinheimera sp. MMS21-TC3]|uniref:polysaccharide pyruvyl transferase family protein n=1 Tax=Rheinheimera sp. MMS21-TC3 TaxID=3072790 RepID=UPI0028C3CBAA|nr:polysaccharide pyruvyl transferase family protein [Rheinheimera sp. MMS21-TC3]WNO61667.1 polysaccharide pyruvyl transferase family protein [Rheinheimera sp. MMS21-TC3]
MKYLITGNHACANRGDAAILRGLLHYLDSQEDSDYILNSRHPDSANFFLNKTVVPDALYLYRKTHNNRLRQKLYWRILPYYLALLMWIFKDKPQAIAPYLPTFMRQQVKQLQSVDAVIQVGGSFFIDLYGNGQFDHAICAIAAGKPLYLAGHSIGPFTGKLYQQFCHFVYRHCHWCGLREHVSAQAAEQANICLNNLVLGADTAWLVPGAKLLANQATVEKSNTIAITVRSVQPFSSRLNIQQHQYEAAMAKLVDQLSAMHYKVVFYSTCTGIDSYANDDRMVAWRIRSLCQARTLPEVEMAELNDVELGLALAKCTLTIATRLHSAIISMNFATPAIAINYEHKSAGIYADMGLSHYAFSMQSLQDGRLLKAITSALSNSNLSAEFTSAVQKQRLAAEQFISAMLKHSKEKV